MACNCPDDIKHAPPEPEPERYEVVSDGRVRFTTADPDQADRVAARWPGGTVRPKA